MGYGFMPGIWTVDAVFFLRRLTEKFRDKNKKLVFIFDDLEKAFAKGSNLFCFDAEECLRIFGKWDYVSL